MENEARNEAVEKGIQLYPFSQHCMENEVLLCKQSMLFC